MDMMRLQGKSTIRGFSAGILERYLRYMDIREAIARLAPSALYTKTVSNLVVTGGKELTADALMGLEAVGLTYHALGTGNAAPALGDAGLATETARKAWTSKTRTGAVITYTVFYLASEAAYNIAECGVFGSASANGTLGSGILFARYLQPYDNSAGLIDLTFEYELEVG